ncbi:PH domain-containing protein [Mycetocola lacteus]|uniref:PH domain-containing protein n=1 Tax=Mycetocola lacteus TaxID=76637 RepID=A0A3L7AY97_9MICO|nr:PH domain-containing protein [Mycetocola lacteus]RLP80813.1 PH domain-containing protein [Mycetocola lacteus]RLP84598.1 PH domain-containing protein [Mycetocola lacteus]
MHDDLRTQVYYSRFNRVLAILVWTLCAALLVIVALMPETSRTLGSVLLPLYIAAAVFIVLWAPRLVVNDLGTTIHNVSRTITIPWAALIHVDTKFALSLHVPDRKFEVWVAPAPGAMSAQRTLRRERAQLRATGMGSSVRPGDLPTSDSGGAAALVRGRWTELREAGRIEAGQAQGTRVSVAWRLTNLIVLVGGAVLVIVGFTL